MTVECRTSSAPLAGRTPQQSAAIARGLGQGGIRSPQFGGRVSDVFVVGDDDQAKGTFLGLAEGMPFRFLDAGPLRNARTVERMTLLSGELGQRLGYFPRMNYRLLGEPWSVGRQDRVRELIASR